ncbi:MAG: CHAD domain-containing protein [Candidatus Acidiferrales bacterium]
MMAHAVALPANSSARRIGLDVWMNRALDLADEAQNGWKSREVHDLRVALRRCRTMADALSEVNPDRGWRRLKKDSRALFHSLGALRDTQVKQEWLKKLSAPNDPVRRQLLRLLAQSQKERQEAARKALADFDRKAWRKSAQRLRSKAQFFPLESVVFQRLALTRLNEAAALYERARKGRSRVAWHRLRIGLKEFRYTLENFMPRRYEPWSGNLKHIQDLLGEVHDLDVLRAEIRRHRAKLTDADVLRWYLKIEEARKARLDEFRSLTSGKDSLWPRWRSGFQTIHVVQPSAFPATERLQSAS